MSDSKKPTVMASGRFLSLVEREGWEYATRLNSTGVVAVVPITDDGKILLVEQYRPPVGKRVIEIPAGLVGDHGDHADETDETAARRELLEETGHEADEWTRLASGPTSPGICDEVMSLFLARRLRRVGEALGDGNEEIVLHEVKLAEVHQWLDRAIEDGMMVDVKVFAGLHLAARAWPEIAGAVYGGA